MPIVAKPVVCRIGASHPIAKPVLSGCAQALSLLQAVAALEAVVLVTIATISIALCLNWTIPNAQIKSKYRKSLD